MATMARLSVVVAALTLVVGGRAQPQTNPSIRWHLGTEYLFSMESKETVAYHPEHPPQVAVTVAEVSVVPFEAPPALRAAADTKSAMEAAKKGTGKNSEDGDATAGTLAWAQLRVHDFELLTEDPTTGQRSVQESSPEPELFGRWFSFAQTPDGRIVSVQYPEDDSVEVVNFKKLIVGHLHTTVKPQQDERVRRDANAQEYSFTTTNLMDHKGTFNASVTVSGHKNGHSVHMRRHPQMTQHTEAWQFEHEAETTLGLDARATIASVAHSSVFTMDPNRERDPAQAAARIAPLSEENRRRRETHEQRQGAGAQEGARPLSDTHRRAFKSLNPGSPTPTHFEDVYNHFGEPFRQVKVNGQQDVKLERVGQRDCPPVNPTERVGFDELEQRPEGVHTVSLTTQRPKLSALYAKVVRQRINKAAPAEKTATFTKLLSGLQELKAEDAMTVLLEEFGAATDSPTRLLAIDLAVSVCHELQQRWVANLLAPKTSLLRPEVLEVLDAVASLSGSCLDTKPVPELIHALQKLAFKQSVYPPPLRTADVRNLAVLVLGAVVKSLHKHDPKHASRLVSGMTSALGYHQPVMELGEGARERRMLISDRDNSRFGADGTELRHKATLLHALGNTGHEDAANHIISYVNGSMVPASLRFAGTHALRHFAREDVEHLLLRTAITDDSETIRNHARDVYMAQPREIDFHDVVTTLQTHSTMKPDNPERPYLQRRLRGLDDLFFFAFKLGLPTFGYVLGDPAAEFGGAAGFGSENNLNLELGLTKSVLQVNVFNEVFAQMQVPGVIFKFVHLKVEYRLDTGFDLNALADFDLDKILNIMDTFDGMVNTVIDRIKTPIETLINLDPVGAITDLVNTLINDTPGAIAELADLLFNGGLLNLLKDAIDAALETADPELIELVDMAQTLVDSIIGTRFRAVKGFVERINHIVTVQIPTIWREVSEAFVTIGRAFEAILRCPITVIFVVIHNALTIVTSFGQIWSLKDELLECAGILTGDLPDWIIPSEEFRYAKIFIQRLGTWARGRKAAMLQFAGNFATEAGTRMLSQAAATGSLQTLLEKQGDLFVKIGAMVDAIMTPINALVVTFRTAKQAVTTFHASFNFVMGQIDQVFGAKFHKSFPKHEATGCGSAKYPSTFGDRIPGSNYNPGIDLKVLSPQELQDIKDLKKAARWPTQHRCKC
eukprot:m.257123 g.257123  ORF g.257123 m.257123 type:complete len:1181 (+) comp19179_c3_seq1:335-3877(+)